VAGFAVRTNHEYTKITSPNMTMKRTSGCWVTLALLALCLGCGSDDKPAYVQTNTGQSCAQVSQCYAGIDAQALQGGEPVCMSQFTSGYCTHHCASDADCCAISGECPVGIVEVCGPFESTGDMYCFLSCEDAAVSSAGVADANAYCARYANPDFICRSTGGGSANRKVCVPNG
jgi:hypothetical protein